MKHVLILLARWNFRCARVSLACLGVLLSAGPVRGEAWPEFRGPSGNGISTAVGLPVEWSADKNVAWKQELPGEGWSSPVLDQDRIYLTAAISSAGTPSSHTLALLILEAASGELVQRVDIFQPGGDNTPAIHKKNSHASPTPIVARDKVFVHFGHQGTACVSAEGKILWKNDQLRYQPVHGNGGSPALLEDRLVFSCDGASDPFLVALNSLSGQIQWRVPRRTEASSPFSFSTPCVIDVDGRKQVISPGSGAVGAFDPQDGREIWRVEYGEGYSVIPRPVYAHGLVYVCTGYGTPNLLAIRPNGRGNVTKTHVAWEVKKGVPHTPSLLLVGDELYMASDKGVASCLDAKTGAAHWQMRLPSAGSDDGISASPLYANGRIYFQTEQGMGIVLKAGKKYEHLASNPLGERTLASYAVVDRDLLIRSAKHLWRISAAAANE